MNNLVGGRVVAPLLMGAAIAWTSPATASTQLLTFSDRPDQGQMSCLREIIQDSAWSDDPKACSDMKKFVQVATSLLNDKGRTDYIYIVMDGIDWCGTAGCQLLIGEVRPNGPCRLLYEGAGDTVFTVLSRRDHDYRRIYTPCEARFAGREYQQVRDECPNPDVHH